MSGEHKLSEPKCSLLMPRIPIPRPNTLNTHTYCTSRIVLPAATFLQPAARLDWQKEEALLTELREHKRQESIQEESSEEKQKIEKISAIVRATGSVFTFLKTWVNC